MPSGSGFIVGGSFNGYRGVARGNIARVNSDGTLDAQFAVGAGFDAQVNDMAVQPDGKILVVGNFDHFDGMPAHGSPGYSRTVSSTSASRPELASTALSKPSPCSPTAEP